MTLNRYDHSWHGVALDTWMKLSSRARFAESKEFMPDDFQEPDFPVLQIASGWQPERFSESTVWNWVSDAIKSDLQVQKLSIKSPKQLIEQERDALIRRGEEAKEREVIRAKQAAIWNSPKEKLKRQRIAAKEQAKFERDILIRKTNNFVDDLLAAHRQSEQLMMREVCQRRELALAARLAPSAS